MTSWFPRSILSVWLLWKVQMPPASSHSVSMMSRPGRRGKRIPRLLLCSPSWKAVALKLAVRCKSNLRKAACFEKVAKATDSCKGFAVSISVSTVQAKNCGALPAWSRRPVSTCLPAFYVLPTPRRYASRVITSACGCCLVRVVGG